MKSTTIFVLFTMVSSLDTCAYIQTFEYHHIYPKYWDTVTSYHFCHKIQACLFYYLSPVVQSIISLTNLLAVKILTALVSTISNSQVFLLKKM